MRVTAARLVLAAAAEVREVVPGDDPRSLVELADALRQARPDFVLACARQNKDSRSVADSLEALRLGCAAQQPQPRVIALGDPGATAPLRAAARPFAFETHTDPGALVGTLREHRRGGDGNLTLRDELLEDGARSLAASSSADAVVIDVSEASTSCVLARPDGAVEAAHRVNAGLGSGGDRVIASAGIDRVRRWLPWPIDAPALLDRVFNRARWPEAVPASEIALAIEMALAREAISLVIREAAAAGLDVTAMRAARTVLVAGRAAGFPRPGQTLLVLVDGLEPSSLTTVWREADDTAAQRVALVAPIAPRRSAKVRLVHREGREEQRVPRGSFVLTPAVGDVDVSGDIKGRGHAGSLGVLIDARGRPLELPHRDAERVPTVARWHIASGALAADKV
jgi:hypothetical protein